MLFSASTDNTKEYGKKVATKYTCAYFQHIDK